MIRFWRLYAGLRATSKRAIEAVRVLVVRPYRTAVVEEQLPAKFKKKRLYVVVEDGFQEQAAMLCPCGCKRVLHMNLLIDERPCWKVTNHPDGTPSLHPSVWRQKDCGSHFWLKKGRVIWC